jgi:hypothetical protein
VTLSEELALLLQQRGHGVYDPAGATSTIYLGTLADTPDVAVALAQYPAGVSDSLLGLDETRWQLRVRGTQDYRTGETLAQALYDDLVGLQTVMPGGTVLQLCYGVQAGPQYLGMDARRRHEFVLNLALTLRRVTAHRV